MLASGKGDRSGRQVYIAAFGKHPGWDDHIEDLGIETEHLASLKQLLYVQGIGGQIDAGAWENLGESQRNEGFRHVFLCRTASDVTLGRLWSSVDGKGRARYPMVVCAQASGVPIPWLVREFFPRLEELQENCVQAKTAGEVIAAMDQAREACRAAIETAELEDPAYAVSSRTLAGLADRPELGEQQEGLFRILYQVEREMFPFLRGNYAPMRDTETRPVQLRVPACSDRPPEAILQWLDFLLGRIDPAVEVWLILPLNRAWVDLFVGRPYPQQFFCFQASREALPLASEIPYTMDEAFLARSREAVAASREGRTEEIVVKADAPAPTGRILAEKLDVGGKLAALTESKAFRMAAIALIAVAVVLGLLIAAVSLWPTGREPNKPENGATHRVTMDPKAAKDWEALCLALDGWMARFLADLDHERLERWRADPDLRTNVVPLLAKVVEGERKLDPRRFANLEGTTLRLAARRPPLSVRKNREIIAYTHTALVDVHAVRDALGPKGWQTRQRLKELSAQFVKLGWGKQASYLGTVANGMKYEPGLARGVDEVVAAGVQAERLAAEWAELDKLVATIEANGPPLMKAFRSRYVAPRTAAPGTVGEVSDLADMRERLGPIKKLAKGLADFLRPLWRDGLDLEMVRADPPVSSDPKDWPADQLADGTLFERWLRGIQGEKYKLLSPDTDPRTAAWKKRQEDRFASTAKTTALLKNEHKDPNAAQYTAELQQLKGEFSRICSLKWNRVNKEGIEQAVSSFDKGPTDLSNKVGDVLLGYIGGLDKFIESLPTSISQKSEAINQAWRQRRDEIAKGATSITKLRPAIKALRESLERLDGELADTLPGAKGDKEWLRNLAGRPLLTAREHVLQSALAYMTWRNGQPVRNAEFDEVWQQLRKEYDRWRTDAAEIVVAFTDIKAALDAGASLEEKIPPLRKSVGETYAQVQARPAWQNAKTAAVFDPVTARLDRLIALAKSADRPSLADQAGNAVGGRFEAARAAWRRLARLSPPWPVTPAELEREHDIGRALAAAYDLLSDEARKQSLNAELRAGTRRRWEAYLNSRTSAAECDDAIRKRAAYHADSKNVQALQPINQFRILLYGMRQNMLTDRAGRDDASVRQAVAGFLAAAKKLPGGVAGARPVAEFLAELAGIAEAENTGADLSKAALAGVLPKNSVVVDPAPDGSSVTYRWLASGGGRHTLKFVRVEPAGGKPSFLSTTEVSVGLFNDAVKARARWREFKDLLPTYESVMDDVRAGPRVWQTADGGEGVTSAAFWRWTPGLNEATFYPEGFTPGPITDNHPMQHVSVEAAAYLAALLGCRLPTAAEWQHARRTDANSPPAAANLRDKTWRRQKDHIAELGAKVGAVYAYPDAGAFWPANMPAGQRKTGPDAQALDSDDGVLWFAKVESGRAGAFRHLVGNVAELVLDAPAAAEQLKNVKAADVRVMLQKNSSAVRVIGGSALSAPAIDPATAYAPEFREVSSREGYADVGFRLAFTAPAMPLRTRLHDVLTRSGYPPTPAAPPKPPSSR